MYINKLNQKLTNLIGIVFFIGSVSLSSSCSKTDNSIDYNKDQTLIEYKQVLTNVIADLNKLHPSVKINPGLISQILKENQAKDILMPLIDISKTILKAYHIYDSVIKEVDGDEKSLIIAGILVFKNEVATNITIACENKIKTFSDYSILNDDIDRQELNGCLLEVFGIEAGVYGLIKVEGKIIVKNLVGLVMKVGLKSLSWVGIAYSVYNLTICLVEADKD